MPKKPYMHDGSDYRLISPAISVREGVMRADGYDDVYFSREDGLAETRHVFFAGNDLPARMAQTSYLCIAETGFGSGLNLLALMAEMTRFPDLHVDFLSVEAYPLDEDQMAFVHDQFPELALHGAALRALLPPRWPGQHVVALLGGRLSLHLLYGAADTVLPGCDFRADCWFLDGFSPAKNPDFWSPAILRQIGRLTAGNGTVASFTAAAAVRDGLTEAGFTIEKRRGFGRKRDMIVGRKGSHAGDGGGSRPSVARVGVIGGGIAGASVAAGLVRRGTEVTILEAGPGLANAASGNRLALQSPRLAVDHNPASRLSATCLAFAATLSDRAGASVAAPVLALDWPTREAERHAKFRRQSWPDSLAVDLSMEAASAQSGVDISLPAMRHDYGRVIKPAKLIAWLAKSCPVITDFVVSSCVRDDHGVTVIANDGRQENFDAIVLANGAEMPKLLGECGCRGVTLDVTAGQVSHLPATAQSARLCAGLSYGGYLTPAIDGLHELGATFDRDAAMEVTSAGHSHNFDLLPSGLRTLFAGIGPDSLSGRTSRRVSTPDRNPISGRLAERVFVLGALGARGFTFAPLLGDQLAALMLGRAVSFDLPTRQLLDPYRFRDRASRL
ncbi:MAG: tRNA (5-methylaminomethyl-2-thiouridine)(34)-methyltransferase MnmD [Alphaproteobacteria bacterium]